MTRRLLAALGTAALLTVAGCGDDDVAGAPTPTPRPTLEKTAPAEQEAGFDECELVMARSVLSEEDSMSCYFSGGGASLEVILLTDPDRAAQAAVEPADITHADLGDGGKVDLTDAESLSARVNLGERVVVITATYETAPGTTPAPGDVEMVQAVVDAISEGN